jgi:3-dehydroquinate synthase
MVDSSVGGKTAVNLSSGKNLAGAFYQPSLVLCDPDTLSTLPSHRFADGIAETIKYALIKDKELFEILKTNDIMEYAEDIIERCVSIKAEIVENDEKDLGIRQLLNFGHTIGHAIEKCSGFKITHGHAVSIGMVIISKAYGKSELLDELLALLSKYNLPSSCRFNADELYAASLSDKKRHGGSICIVVPEEIGNCVLKEIPIDELRGFIEKGVSI